MFVMFFTITTVLDLMTLLRDRVHRDGYSDVTEVRLPGLGSMEWERDREWDWTRDYLPLEQTLRDKLKR